MPNYWVELAIDKLDGTPETFRGVLVRDVRNSREAEHEAMTERDYPLGTHVSVFNGPRRIADHQASEVALQMRNRTLDPNRMMSISYDYVGERKRRATAGI